MYAKNLIVIIIHGHLLGRLMYSTCIMLACYRDKVEMTVDKEESKEDFIKLAHNTTEESKVVKEMAKKVATVCTNERLKKVRQNLVA